MKAASFPGGEQNEVIGQQKTRRGVAYRALRQTLGTSIGSRHELFNREARYMRLSLWHH